MAVDISIDLCGIKLKNPFILSAGPAGNSGDKLKEIALEGNVGAVTTTTLCSKETGLPAYLGTGPSPRMARIRRNIKSEIAITDFGRPTVEEWTKKEMDKAKEGRVPIIVSIMGTKYPENWVRLAKIAEEAGASILECTMSAPHSYDWLGGIPLFVKGVAPEILRAVKKAVKIPVFTKIPYLSTLNFETYIPDIVKAGVDGITCHGMVPVTIIDEEVYGKQPLALPTRYGCLAGSVAISAGLFMVQALHTMIPGYSFELPIIASGGVSSGIDGIKYTMAGATGIASHTIIPMIKGPRAFRQAQEEMISWMEKHGYQNLKMIRGISLQYFGQGNFQPLVAQVDEELCIGCGQCETVCRWAYNFPPQAIKVDKEKGKAKVEEKHCQGCGWCWTLCPQDAITLKGW